jgi:molybdopterin-containing oxidoreductase family iron-sulfur binding subunit
MSFERFEDAVPTGAPVPMATLAQPLLVRTLYDTRSMPDALLAIAKSTGRADAFLWSSYEAALREAWAGLDTSWSDALARGGFWSERNTEEPGHYRFETKAIRERSQPTAGLELHVYASNALGDGRSAHLPFLQELSDPITGIRWGSVIELSTERAEELGITSGDLVELRSESGALEAPAHVTPGLHPDMVALAAGQGHTGYGRYSEGRGVNGFAILDPASDADGALLAGTKVTVRKL